MTEPWTALLHAASTAHTAVVCARWLKHLDTRLRLQLRAYRGQITERMLSAFLVVAKTSVWCQRGEREMALQLPTKEESTLQSVADRKTISRLQYPRDCHVYVVLHATVEAAHVGIAEAVGRGKMLA